MQNVQEKMQAISAAQNAFATIESIRPGAIPHETKVLLAELKVDLMDIQDAQEEQNSSGPFGNDILGKWMNKRNYIKFMYYKKEGWRDIHASLVDQPENIDNVNKYIDFDRKLEKKAKFIKRLMRFKSKFKFF